MGAFSPRATTLTLRSPEGGILLQQFMFEYFQSLDYANPLEWRYGGAVCDGMEVADVARRVLLR